VLIPRVNLPAFFPSMLCANDIWADAVGNGTPVLATDAVSGIVAEGSSAISSMLGGMKGNVPKNESATEAVVTGRDCGGPFEFCRRVGTTDLNEVGGGIGGGWAMWDMCEWASSVAMDVDWGIPIPKPDTE
jgi:hypothetical protein